MHSTLALAALRRLRNSSVRIFLLLLGTLPSERMRDRLNKALNKASPKRFLRYTGRAREPNTELFARDLSREFQIWENGIRSHALTYYNRTKAARPRPAIAPIGGAGHAVIVDPHFNPFSGHSGHHGTLNHFYDELLREMGLDAQIFGKFAMPMPAEDCQYHFTPAFTLDFYKPSSTSLGLTGQLQDNLYFERELKKNVPATAQVYVAHSVRHNIVLGLASWIKEELDQENRCIILGIIDNQLGVNAQVDQVVTELYRQAFSLLRQVRKAHFLIYCETQRQIDILNDVGAEGLDLRLFRYVGGALALRSGHDRTSPRAENAKILVGFAGGTRAERGVDLLPSLVRQVDRNLPGMVNWAFQLNLRQLKANGVTGEDIAALRERENVKLIDGSLSVGDYYRLIKRMDIIILPYRERYETTGSGVFIEALSLGKVLVIPKRGWMAECALMCGGEPVTFDSADVANVSAAIQVAVENFRPLQERAMRAAQVWNNYQAGGSQIQSWLGERLSDPLNDSLLPADRARI